MTWLVPFRSEAFSSSSASGLWLTLPFLLSELVSLLIFPARLLANQRFIKLIQAMILYSQCTRALSHSISPFFYFLPSCWPISILLNQYEWQFFTVYKSILPPHEKVSIKVFMVSLWEKSVRYETGLGLLRGINWDGLTFCPDWRALALSFRLPLQRSLSGWVLRYARI